MNTDGGRNNDQNVAPYGNDVVDHESIELKQPQDDADSDKMIAAITEDPEKLARKRSEDPR